MNEKELREWGRQWCPCTTNPQSLRWLHDWPVRIREMQDKIEREQAQKGNGNVVH